MNSVAIVGGGITGLCAAFRLRQQKVPVTLYEEGERVGGPIRTLCENGYMAEYGPNTILETSPKIAALITDLGLDPRRRDSDPAANKNYIVRNGRMHPLPVSAGAFAATPLFSLAGKLRIAAEPFIRKPPVSDDESLADFVVRRLGREFLDYAINPFVSGIYAGDPAKLSVRHAFPKLHKVEAQYGSLILGQFLGARERKKRAEVAAPQAKKVSFDAGLQVLTDTLHVQLGSSVELHSSVHSVEKSAEGWTVTVLANGREERRNHSAVLFTAPAHKLASVRITDGEAVSLAALGEIEHPSVARIVLGFRREDVADPLDGFGFLVPELERLSILGTTFSSSIFANRAPEGHVTLTSFMGGCRSPELANRAPDELFERAAQDLKAVLGVRGKPTYQHHALFPWAIPQYNVGYGKFMDLMAETETRHPGLFFAGNYRNGISVGNSIVAGQEVASRVATYCSSDTLNQAEVVL
ncbi:MAG: protoporphyrinogen oxidase [Verrucomicrobia bacterium]|nr:protoporphyrinogen oxidase [Verrucomicrobiota bacterium]